MEKKLLFFLFVFWVSFFSWTAKSEAYITIISPENKIYIFTNTIFVVGKTDAKKLRYSNGGEEGPSVDPRDGNFHFQVNLNNGLNKIEISGPEKLVKDDKGNEKLVKEKVHLEIFSLKNYKFFVLKTYDSTGPAGFNRYIFHTGEKDGQCVECHVMDPMKSGKKMCFKLCHKNDIMKWGYMHGPTGEGACLACHDPEGSINGYKVVVDGGGEICLTCHEGIGLKKPKVHTAVSKKLCMGCHNPHGTINNFVLREDGKAKMCYLCHLDKKVKWKTARDANGNESFVENGEHLFPHKAVSDGDCLVCHHPHESDNLFNLRQRPGKLCVETECHIPVSEKIEKHKHPYDVTPTSGAPVKIGEDIFIDEKGNIICYSCHDIHGSDNKFIFRKPREKLCRSCHTNLDQFKITFD